MWFLPMPTKSYEENTHTHVIIIIINNNNWNLLYYCVTLYISGEHVLKGKYVSDIQNKVADK